MLPSTFRLDYPPPFNQNLSKKNLIEAELNHPSNQLPIDESIALLIDCIRQGEKNSSQMADKDIVAIIGNTQSGKSTLVNDLCGCQIESRSAKELGIIAPAGRKLIVVKESAQEVMKIGHTNVSKTFMPQLAQAPSNGQDELFFCDCPGFLDTRGVAINIANAVNIRQALMSANSVRIVILINYKSLDADRANGLRELIKICSDLFGSTENFLQSKDSILFGITHVPSRNENEEVHDLQELKEWIRKTDHNDQLPIKTLQVLSERVFIYDPLEKSDLSYSGGLKGESLLEAVRSLHPVENPRSIFKAVLNSSDKQELVAISDKILLEIVSILGQEGAIDYGRVSDLFHLLKKLDIIDHSHVSDLIDKIKKEIQSHFERKAHEMNLSLEESSLEHQLKAKQILSELKEALLYFDEEFQAELRIDSLEGKLSTHFNHLDAENAAGDNGSFVKLFYEALTRYDFVQAQQLFKLLDEKHSQFEQRYSSTGINSGIDLEALKFLYDRSKETYDGSKRKISTEERGIEIEKERIQRNKDIIQLKEMRLDQLQREVENQKLKTRLSAEALEKQTRKTEEENRRLQEQEEAKQQAKLSFLNQQTAIQRAMLRLDQACYDKNLAEVKKALREGSQASPNTLMWAVRSGNPEIIKAVSAKGAKPNEQTLNCAFATQKIEIIDWALWAGAFPTFKTLEIAEKSQNPLLIAKIKEIILRFEEHNRKLNK